MVTGASWLVSWTLPATHFNLLATAYLTNPIPWVDLTNIATVPLPEYQVGTNMHALVANIDLPGTNSTFFALRRDVALRLQVLMPGETNAPGTATGRIGTPLPQRVGVPFDITVHGTDANWHIMPSCVDSVNISSSDPFATGTGPVTLVNGTATVPFAFTGSGLQTITGTDALEATATETVRLTVNP